jgi:glucokinase
MVHMLPDLPVAVSIDIGGSLTKLALVSTQGLCPDTFRQVSTAAHGEVEGFISDLVEQAARLAEESPEPVRGIGICVPGFLHDDLGSIAYNPNTPALVGYPLRRRIATATNLPVAIEIDCNAAAMAEYRFGVGHTARRLLVLSLGTGVGAGMVVDGKPMRCASGCCGDAGHVYVGGDARCTAGCQGCLESVISVEALRRASGFEEIRELIDAARAGNARAAAVLRKAGERLGLAIASLSTILQPDLVLLAGGISEADALITGPAQQAFEEYAAPYFHIPIRKGSLGATAALLGAALSILEHHDNWRNGKL